MKFILTIAGSDSIGGAGIQADIKTITALGGHALTVISAVTAQNSRGVQSVHALPVAVFLKQLAAIMEDIRPDAVKIGMLANQALMRAAAGAIKKYGLTNVVIDPVLKSSTGHALAASAAAALYREMLFPLADVVTPNLEEAGIFSHMRVRNMREMRRAAKVLHSSGPGVIITGGHLKTACTDLVFDGRDFYALTGPKIDTLHTHGTGCTFAGALATCLAHGDDLVKAAKTAKLFTTASIRAGYACGRGAGSVNQAGRILHQHGSRGHA